MCQNGSIPHREKKTEEGPRLEPPPLDQAVLGICAYINFFLFSKLTEFIFGVETDKDGKGRVELDHDDYVPLYTSFEIFFVRQCLRRIMPVFFRPISSVPGAKVTILERTSEDNYQTHTMDRNSSRECINLGSYNYLGFAENTGDRVESVIQTVHKVGLSICSTRHELGTMEIHNELEKVTACFLGTDDAMTFGQGFSTNTLNLPTLISKGTLVVSDEKNHASVVLGLRLSGASLKVFKHNDVAQLEAILGAQPCVVSQKPSDLGKILSLW
jgi:serine palmitoyltransferase